MIAFYLKYRPQTLDDLAGQIQIKESLKVAFTSGKLSHAYLFAGPRGTGKTSTARILAKMVNCRKSDVRNQKSDTKIPCNECDVCLSITDGSNLDLIEIDAASNRGIDDIRALRETIKLAPSNSKKKVYIIDEVHMLTTEDFNALLKTLEEPPEHSIFILATTDSQKIPQTIISRVTRFDFKSASVSSIVEALQKIVVAEKIIIDKEALTLIGKKADGSFRDGVKFLEQLGSLGKEIKIKDVEEILNAGNFEVAISLLGKVSEKNTKEALEILIKEEDSGIQIKDFTLFLMENLRYLVLMKNGLGQTFNEDLGSDKYEKLQELSEKFNMGDLIKAINSFQEAYEKIKIAGVTSLPLELAMVDICSDLKVEGSDLKVDLEVRESKIDEKNQPSTIQSQAPASIFEHPASTSNPDISKLMDKWTFILETIRQYNYSLEALLRNAKIIGLKSAVVLIEVPYTFHQRILEQPKNRDLLEAIISEVLSEQIKVSTVLGQRPQRREDIANVEFAKEDEIITLASEIFNGKLVD